ncbi:MAG: hypothetical protein J6I73_09535 [Treponema sp.]|nr:hypothetical protein [Treponema sp.]
MKKLCLAVLAACVFVSCSDIFGGKETQRITFTIPSFQSESASRAVESTSASLWSVRAYLIGDSADITSGVIANARAGKSFNFAEFTAQAGVMATVEHKNVDLSKDVAISFAGVRERTRFFVMVFISYGDDVVFYGTGPEPISNSEPYATAQVGETPVTVVLHKNTACPVYFVAQNGSGTAKSNTPKKPVAFNMLLNELEDVNEAVLILTENVTSSEEINIDEDDKNKFKLSVTSLPGKQYALEISGDDTFSITSTFSLSLLDVDFRMLGENNAQLPIIVTSGGTLELGGSVVLQGGITITPCITVGGENNDAITAMTSGVVRIVRPLTTTTTIPLKFDFVNNEGSSMNDRQLSNTSSFFTTSTEENPALLVNVADNEYIRAFIPNFSKDDKGNGLFTENISGWALSKKSEFSWCLTYTTDNSSNAGNGK